MFGIKRSKADALFSNLMREKADFTCERCHLDFHEDRRILSVSHFWSRRNKSVRFDPENVSVLCFSCHRHFTENPEAHREFFLKRLGQRRFDALGCRARTLAKVDEKALVIAFKEELKNMKESKRIADVFKKM